MDSIGSIIPSQSNNQYMGFNYGNLAFEKLESTIYVDIKFFLKAYYKTVSLP